MGAALAGVRFREVICSGPMLIEARRRTGVRKVPVIETRQGWITDSTRILRWLDAQLDAPVLYPADRDARMLCDLLEDWADEALGRAVEPWIWIGDGRQPMLNAICAAEQEHLPSRWLMRLLSPLQRFSFNSRVQLHGGLDATRALIGQQLDLLAARLEDRPWLLGDRPTATDCAVAGQLANLYRFGIADDLEQRPAVARLVRRAIALLPEADVFGL